MNEPNIIILAGGISSRMKKSNSSLDGINSNLLNEVRFKSKSMLGVGINSRPFLDYLLLNIESAGYQNVVIVTGEKDPSIHDYYERDGKKKQFKNLSLSYAIQRISAGRTKPLGSADALLVALKSRPDWKNQSFTVCNSDNLYSVHALKVLMDSVHKNALIDYDQSALRFDPVRIQAFSVIHKDKDGFLLDIIEKPSPKEIEKAKDINGRIGISMNIFRFSYNMILPFLESVPMHPIRQEKELPTAVKLMVEKYPRSVFTIPLSEHVIDLTGPSDIKNVQEYLRNKYRFTNDHT